MALSSFHLWELSASRVKVVLPVPGRGGGDLAVHPTAGCRAWHRAALSKPALLREGCTAPARPAQTPSAPARPAQTPSVRQALLAKAPVTDCVERGLHTVPARDCVFSLCEQKVSVSYLKSIYNIPFGQLGVTRLPVNGTVCCRVKDNAKAF